jgi:hypothetical protein
VQDAAELEQVLRQHLAPPDVLKCAHALLRSFRALLFTETSAMQSSDVHATLPRSTICLHLLSRLPADVCMPYERTNVTVKQFSQWMDRHSQAEVLEAILLCVGSSSKSEAGSGVRQLIRNMAAS